jgi:hypothetical protein
MFRIGERIETSPKRSFSNYHKKKFLPRTINFYLTVTRCIGHTKWTTSKVGTVNGLAPGATRYLPSLFPAGTSEPNIQSKRATYKI